MDIKSLHVMYYKFLKIFFQLHLMFVPNYVTVRMHHFLFVSIISDLLTL